MRCSPGIIIDLDSMKSKGLVLILQIIRFNAKEKKIRDEKRKQMLDDCCEPTPTRARGGG